MSAVIKPTFTSFVQLLEREDLFDHWVAAFQRDDVIGIRGCTDQSPVERWLSVNGYPVKVYPDYSHSLVARCTTPRWARFLLSELDASGQARHPVYAWEVQKIRRFFDSNLFVVGGQR